MKNASTFLVIAVIVTLLGIGCTDKKATTPIQPLSTTSTPPTPITPIIPDGWQLLTNEEYGIQVVAPRTLEYLGCQRPVKLEITDNQFGVGALFTSCNEHDERFDDIFGGRSISVLTNMHSIAEIQKSFEEKSRGWCQIHITDLNQTKFEVTSNVPPVNQWAPNPCGSAEIYGFYNLKTHTFVHWIEREKSFPIGPDEYADDKVQILPLY